MTYDIPKYFRKLCFKEHSYPFLWNILFIFQFYFVF